MSDRQNSGKDNECGGLTTDLIDTKVKKRPNYIILGAILLGIILLIVVIGSLGTDSSPDSLAAEPLIITVDELVEALANNTATATKAYLDKNVQLTGRLLGIDSGGDYVAFAPLYSEKEYFSGCSQNVNGRINDEQLEILQDCEPGQTITVTGTITNVGPVLGYFLDIDKIL